MRPLSGLRVSNPALTLTVSKMADIKVGDKVVHDYSLHTGKVLAVRKHPNGYNYQVDFYLPEQRKHVTDWFKRSVLRIK